MDINEKCDLVLNDVYLFDIKSCHYNILDSLGFDLSKINKEDKKSRNIKIGYMMKENPRLISLLRSITISIVDEFIFVNNIKPEEIICRQYDGLLITRPVEISDKLILKDLYTKLIISDDRNSYIALNDNQEIIIKGISNRYRQIDDYYSKLLKINFANKKSIFKSLKKIRDEIYYCEFPELFCIPHKENKYEVILKRYGKMKISETIINMLDVEDIDRRMYFDIYLKSFIDVIVKEYIW